MIPDCKAAKVGPLPQLYQGAKVLQDALASMHAEEDGAKKAHLARHIRLEVMVEVRKICDAAEALVPTSVWSLATYKELLLSRNYAKNLAAKL